ncbi:MAG: dephospho-CoA kinase [Rickettsiaceae bacterium]|nr:dephospho-CoA kinase [Rickettsiaceae bacterium]
MKTIAITGSFATGKTFVLQVLKELNYQVFSCDEYVKQLYQDPKIQNLIITKIDEIQEFNLEKLRQVLFADDISRQKIEAIIHPLVREAIEEFTKLNQQEKLLFFEVPLLFETGFEKYFDYSITVYCPENIRIERAMQKKNFNKDLLERINKIQLPQQEKINKADFTIDSNCGGQELRFSLQQIIDKLLN